MVPLLGRPYSGGSYTISSTGLIAYTSCSPYRPADVSIVKKGNKTLQLTDLNKDILDYITLGKVEDIWYKSDYDGRDVQGWYVLPPNYDPAKEYPLLVENHGAQFLIMEIDFRLKYNFMQQMGMLFSIQTLGQHKLRRRVW